MCPSCVPALPVLAGTLAGGGLRFGLKALFEGLVGRCQMAFHRTRRKTHAVRA